MATKESPIRYRTYHKVMVERIQSKQEELEARIVNSKKEIETLYNSIKEHIPEYEKKYKIIITKDCFDNDDKAIKKVINILSKCEDCVSQDLFVVARLFKKVEQVYHMTKRSNLYSKILELNDAQYLYLLRVYFYEVHKQMILNGYGYHLGQNLGDICIYRYKNCKTTTYLDYYATKKKKDEIIARGGRIYNKKEAEWCAARGIPYEYEDHRVYKHDDYLYDVYLFNVRLPQANLFVFTPTDFRAPSIRGKSNDDLITECDSKKEAILKLPIDMKTKLTLCLQIDPTLYNNFIRNENQTSMSYRKTDSEDRQ